MPKQPEYPIELTQKQWEKKKPLVLKARSTGIGEALEDLSSEFSKIKWSNFETGKSLKQVDDKLRDLPEMTKNYLGPTQKAAEKVRELASDWSTKLKKEKLTPKAASDACDVVVTAAKKFLSELEDFPGFQANEYVELRKELVSKIASDLKPQLEKAKKKIENLLLDIKAFYSKPSEEKFWELFSKDSNARGYTTACKNFDQWLPELPEIRNKVYDGDAMKEFYPCMAIYGAEVPKAQFDAKVNKKLCPNLNTPKEIYEFHAKQMVLASPTIKEFLYIIDKILDLLDG